MALGVKPSNVWDASMEAARRWGEAYKSTEITKDELFAKIHQEARDMGWSPEDATVIAGCAYGRCDIGGRGDREEAKKLAEASDRFRALHLFQLTSGMCCNADEIRDAQLLQLQSI